MAAIYYISMISLIQKGTYQLIETKKQTKILILDVKNTYAWINVQGIGEILVTSHNPHITDNVLALGRYRIYKVKNEPELTDLIHLELHAGNGTWQGYLLPTGLPTDTKKRNRVIPTNEIITKATD